MTSQQEIQRRYDNVRRQAQEGGWTPSSSPAPSTRVRGRRPLPLRLPAAAPVRVRRPAVDGEPSVVFPKEARWVGDHGEAWIEDKVFAEHPGQWIADRGFERIGVYGLDYVMPVRDYRPLADVALPWDQGFDTARAVKSEEELASVRGELPAERGRSPRRARRLRGRQDRGRGDGRGRAHLRLARHLADDDGHGAHRLSRRRRPRVQAPEPHPSHRAGRPVALRPRDRRLRRALGRVLTAVLRGRAERRHPLRTRGLPQYARQRARPCAPAHRARRPHGRFEALQGPRLHARPRHRPLDRDDDESSSRASARATSSSSGRTW